MDLIHEVGPGGNYLSHDHTYKNMYQFSNSSLFDRRNRADWLDHTRGQDFTERAYDEARQIIQTHKPLPLPEDVPEAMRAIISEFEKSS